MLQLYHAAASTCSQRVRQALHEKDLEWVDRHLRLDQNEHLTPEYLALNPNGLVPTLVHDGYAIPDSSVILEYLEDAFPARPLRPADNLQRARMRAWIRYIDEVPTAAARYPSFQLIFGKRLMQLSKAERAKVAASRPIRAGFYSQFGANGFADDVMDLAMRQLEQAFDRMQNTLSSVPWLLGESFSIVDISLLPTVVRMDDLRLSHFYESRSNVADWYERIQQRPSFAAAYYPASRVSVV